MRISQIPAPSASAKSLIDNKHTDTRMHNSLLHSSPPLACVPNGCKAESENAINPLREANPPISPNPLGRWPNARHACFHHHSASILSLVHLERKRSHGGEWWFIRDAHDGMSGFGFLSFDPVKCKYLEPIYFCCSCCCCDGWPSSSARSVFFGGFLSLNARVFVCCGKPADNAGNDNIKFIDFIFSFITAWVPAALLVLGRGRGTEILTVC